MCSPRALYFAPKAIGCTDGSWKSYHHCLNRRWRRSSKTCFWRHLWSQYGLLLRAPLASILLLEKLHIGGMPNGLCDRGWRKKTWGKAWLSPADFLSGSIIASPTTSPLKSDRRQLAILQITVTHVSSFTVGALRWEPSGAAYMSKNSLV